MRSITLMILLTTVGCTASGTPPPPPPLPPIHGGGECREGAGAAFVGRVATSQLGAEMLEATGARRLRWVPHGRVITMEFSPERLTVRLDQQNRVLSANCG